MGSAEEKRRKRVRGPLWVINKSRVCGCAALRLHAFCKKGGWARILPRNHLPTRNFEKTCDLARRSSLPWRSHFLRKSQLQFLQKTAGRAAKGECTERRACDVVRQPANREDLPTCAITGRRGVEVQNTQTKAAARRVTTIRPTQVGADAQQNYQPARFCRSSRLAFISSPINGGRALAFNWKYNKTNAMELTNIYKEC